MKGGPEAGQGYQADTVRMYSARSLAPNSNRLGTIHPERQIVKGSICGCLFHFRLGDSTRTDSAQGTRFFQFGRRKQGTDLAYHGIRLRRLLTGFQIEMRLIAAAGTQHQDDTEDCGPFCIDHVKMIFVLQTLQLLAVLSLIQQLVKLYLLQHVLLKKKQWIEFLVYLILVPQL